MSYMMLKTQIKHEVPVESQNTFKPLRWKGKSLLVLPLIAFLNGQGNIIMKGDSLHLIYLAKVEEGLASLKNHMGLISTTVFQSLKECQTWDGKQPWDKQDNKIKAIIMEVRERRKATVKQEMLINQERSSALAESGCKMEMFISSKQCGPNSSIYELRQNLCLR